jgi:hypothetical protein
MDKNHPFAELFPVYEPDPVWNAHFEKMDKQIQILFESGNLLDAYILAIRGQAEYCSVKRKPGNHQFLHWTTDIDFIKIRETYSDFRYIFGLCRLQKNFSSFDFLVKALDCLTAMKENRYTPMSPATKLEIQKQIYQHYEIPEWYLDIIGDEDVIHCKQHQKDSSIN